MKKKTFFTLILTFLLGTPILAHHMWVEADPAGKIDERQAIHVFFGEYSYNYLEKVTENFKEVEDFSLWLVTPDNQKVELQTEAGEDRYTAHFTPDQEGVYTILLSSKETEVVDWTGYDLGVLKPDFYASATVAVGKNGTSGADPEILSGTNNLVILNSGIPGEYRSDSIVSLNVLFNGEPVAEQKVIIGISDQWSKTVYTDEHGVAEFMLPWEGQYVIETVYTEEVPGRFKNTGYEAVRHTATYSIQTLTL